MSENKFYNRVKSIVGWVCEIESDDLRRYIDVKRLRQTPPTLTFGDVEDVVFGGLIPDHEGGYADAYVLSAWHVPLNRPCTDEELRTLDNQPDFYKVLAEYLK